MRSCPPSRAMRRRSTTAVPSPKGDAVWEDARGGSGSRRRRLARLTGEAPLAVASSATAPVLRTSPFASVWKAEPARAEAFTQERPLEPPAGARLRRAKAGGESGIRTRGTVSRTHAFQACALNHSAISPFRINDLPSRYQWGSAHCDTASNASRSLTGVVSISLGGRSCSAENPKSSGAAGSRATARPVAQT
jgi:hypothetical protein